MPRNDHGAYIVCDCIPGVEDFDLSTCTRDSAFAWKGFGCQLVAWMMTLSVRITEIWHAEGSSLFVVLRVGDECTGHIYDNIIGAHDLHPIRGSLYRLTCHVYQCWARSHIELTELGTRFLPNILPSFSSDSYLTALGYTRFPVDTWCSLTTKACREDLSDRFIRGEGRRSWLSRARSCLPARQDFVRSSLRRAAYTADVVQWPALITLWESTPPPMGERTVIDLTEDDEDSVVDLTGDNEDSVVDLTGDAGSIIHLTDTELEADDLVNSN